MKILIFSPPAPGEIIIRQEANTLTAPAPPIVLRQQAARPATPEPLVIREAPPLAPAQVGRKVITISGKRIPPPPRTFLFEDLFCLLQISLLSFYYLILMK